MTAGLWMGTGRDPGKPSAKGNILSFLKFAGYQTGSNLVKPATPMYLQLWEPSERSARLRSDSPIANRN